MSHGTFGRWTGATRKVPAAMGDDVGREGAAPAGASSPAY
jgi:hypothetical protein